MAKTWADVIGKSGYFQSNPILLNAEGNGSLSSVTWDGTTTNNNKIRLFTSLSFNGGYDWTEWREVQKNASVPDLKIDTPLNNVYLRYRAFLETSVLSENPILNSVTFSFEPVLVIDNIGDDVCYPEVWITKTGTGNISLINTSNDNEEFTFTGLNNNETVYVNSEREYIESSLATTTRYGNFNDNYLQLPVGKNVFRINGRAKLQFRFQFPLI